MGGFLFWGIGRPHAGKKWDSQLLLCDLWRENGLQIDSDSRLLSANSHIINDIICIFFLRAPSACNFLSISGWYPRRAISSSNLYTTFPRLQMYTFNETFTKTTGRDLQKIYKFYKNHQSGVAKIYKFYKNYQARFTKKIQNLQK